MYWQYFYIILLNWLSLNYNLVGLNSLKDQVRQLLASLYTFHNTSHQKLGILILITIHFHFLTWHKIIIGKISVWFFNNIIIIQDAAHSRYLHNTISTNGQYSAKFEIETECRCKLMWNSSRFISRKATQRCYSCSSPNCSEMFDRNIES